MRLAAVLLGILVAPALAGFAGMEHSTPVTLADQPMAADLERVLVHEVAHQWWYLLVGSDQPTQPFLDESLTAVSQLLTDDDDRRLAEREFHRSSQMLSAIGAFGRRGLSRAAYKGGARWHLDLRAALGHERYLRGLQRYLRGHRWRLAAPGDLAEALSPGASPAARALLRMLRK